MQESYCAVNVLPNALCVLCHLAVRVLFEFEFKTDVVVRISGSYVPVKVEDRLPCDFAVVAKDIESLKVKG